MKLQYYVYVDAEAYSYTEVFGLLEQLLPSDSQGQRVQFGQIRMFLRGEGCGVEGIGEVVR